MDGGPWQVSRRALSDVTAGTHQVEYSDVTGWIKPPPENVTVAAGPNATIITRSYTEKVMNNANKPFISMSKEDKLQVMRNLKKRGFSLIKGSVKRLSGEWGVSLPTIYKYLEEI